MGMSMRIWVQIDANQADDSYQLTLFSRRRKVLLGAKFAVARRCAVAIRIKSKRVRARHGRHTIK